MHSFKVGIAELIREATALVPPKVCDCRHGRDACTCKGGHDLVKTGDADSCPAIEDRNGEVVLAYCRKCKRGESEIGDECKEEKP